MKGTRKRLNLPELCREAVQRNVCYVLILNDQVYPWDSVSEIQYITEMTW